MVRPGRTQADSVVGSCCIELAGESPVTVSAGAPCSRFRASWETTPSEWNVKSPQRVVRSVGGRQVRRPSIKRTLQPREINTRKVGLAEPLISRRRQQTAPVSRSGAGRPRGREESMRTKFDAEQERPVPAAKSGEGGPYKPMAKAERAGRESEGSIVPLTPAAKAGRGKGPCFGCGRVWR
jgi:hypothetical protein